MPEESTTPDLVELVRRALEAANRRDLDAATSSFAPDAVFEGRALGDIFEGRAAIRSFLEEWFGAYEELEFGLEEVRDLGNGVVFAVVIQNGRLVGSAGHLRQREGWVFVWVGGLTARLTISDIDEARAAAERLAEERARAMSRENSEIVRRAMEAAFRKPEPDFATLNDLYHPDHEFISLIDALEGGKHRGAGGFREWRRNVQDAVEYESRLEQVTEIDGDRLLAVMPTSSRGKASGIALKEQRFGCIVTVRGGKIVRTEVYPSPKEALEAVGLSE
jgi:ketosteroid isomerase-like protein